MKNIPKTHLFTEEDLHTFELQQIFTASSIWYELGMNDLATYDLVIRDMPKNRNFLLMGGTEEIIEGIRKWRYSKKEVDNLLKFKIITPGFAKYLLNFRFSGQVYALPEGTVFFPGEPIIRIIAPIIEGNLLTMFLMNAVTSNTTFLSKVIRGVIAVKDKTLIITPAMRAHSFESAFKMGRAAYLAGATGANTIPSFSEKYHLPRITVSVKAYHAVIKSFSSELEAMRKTAKIFPNLIDFMVDTYNTEQGVKNAITVAKELKKEGKSIAGITIDSGNLYEEAVKARKLLDKAGLKEIGITLAANLDEWKIDDLVKRKVPADKFIVCTEMIVIPDAPKLEVVYKLAEVRKGQEIIPKAKLAKGKESYPGRKQVFRLYKNGKMSEDIIGLEDESLGKPLLVKMIEKGKVVYDLPDFESIKKYIKEQVFSSLPEGFLDLHQEHQYKVRISSKIEKLMDEVRKKHG